MSRDTFRQTKEHSVQLIETLGPFWIVGIALNLVLTGLALWWVIRAMRPRDKQEPRQPSHDVDAAK